MKPYKDPDEFIKNMGADAFKERIAQAKNSFLFEIDVLKRNYQFRRSGAEDEIFIRKQQRSFYSLENRWSGIITSRQYPGSR